MRYELRNILLNITNVALIIISAFLIGRLLFQILGANSSTPFVSWVYDISSFLMTPFRGIFGVAQINGRTTLDIPALFALVAYAILGFIVMYLIRALTASLSRTDEADLVADDEVHTHSHSDHGEARAHTH